MAENYYSEPNRNLPNIFECHVGSIIDHVASTLFTNEFIKNKEDAYNRILLSDVNSGNNISIGDSYQFFQSMQGKYPFVAYNIGQATIPNDYGVSQSHTIGIQYLEELNAYVKAFPMDFEIQFIAFFNDSLDNRKAMALIQSQGFGLTRLYTKAMFDDIEVVLPITLKIQVDKGELQYELEQYLIQNRIWNFNFTYTCRYYEYLFDEIIYPGYTEKTVYDVTDIYGDKPKNVQQVDSIEINTLKSDTGNTLDSVYVPDSLIVLSSNPKDGDTNFSRTSAITITFNKSIVPSSFIKAFSLFPDIEYDMYYSIDYKIVNVKPVSDVGFDSNKVYRVKITKDLLDGDLISLSDEYSFSFTTN